MQVRGGQPTGVSRCETMVAKDLNPYVGDSTRYRGFYAQDEIRDVVDHPDRVAPISNSPGR